MVVIFRLATSPRMMSVITTSLFASKSGNVLQGAPNKTVQKQRAIVLTDLAKNSKDTGDKFIVTNEKNSTEFEM